MNRSPLSNLNLDMALLAAWLIVGVLLIVWLDPASFILGLAFLTLVSVLALTNLSRWMTWAALAVSILGYAGAQLALGGAIPDVVLPVAATSLILIGATLLAYRTSRRLEGLSRQLDNDRQIIEDLRLHDPKTGLVRFQYARQSLKLEVMRSQRYHIDLSLVLLDMSNRKALEEKYGMIGLEEINNQLAGILLSATREVDTCFINGKVGVILPQTNPDGACIVAERVIGSAARRLSIDLYAGVAYFPRDAVSEDDLIRSAESALQVALTSGRPIVYYSQIQEGLGGASSLKEPETVEKPQ